MRRRVDQPAFPRLRAFVTLDTLRQEVMCMPTKNPRVNVALEHPLFECVSSWARCDGISLSLKVRDVVKAAVEAEENAVLAEYAENGGGLSADGRR